MLYFYHNIRIEWFNFLPFRILTQTIKNYKDCVKYSRNVYEADTQKRKTAAEMPIHHSPEKNSHLAGKNTSPQVQLNGQQH